MTMRDEELLNRIVAIREGTAEGPLSHEEHDLLLGLIRRYKDNARPLASSSGSLFASYLRTFGLHDDADLVEQMLIRLHAVKY